MMQTHLTVRMMSPTTLPSQVQKYAPSDDRPHSFRFQKNKIETVLRLRLMTSPNRTSCSWTSQRTRALQLTADVKQELRRLQLHFVDM
jgi:hypothetical protein